jgi:phospholipase/lecithinase/hemolysin
VTVTALIVFGDSLCDGGNAHALRGDDAFPCPPHWQGRRCDGPVWVEQLAERLGLPPLVHSLAGGSNHAFGGARSGAGLSPKGMPNLLEQVAGFLGEARAGGAGPGPGTGPERLAPTLGLAPFLLSGNPASWDPEALVVLRAGANNYLDAPPSLAVAEAVNRHLLGAVDCLADAGFRHFLVPTELPWGFSPIQLPGLGEVERQGLNALIARQNAMLQEALKDLAARRDLVVVQPDFHALFLAVRADKAAYGFTEIERPVLVLESTVGGAAVGPADTTTAGQPPGASAAPTPDLPVPGSAPARSAAAACSAPGDADLPTLGDAGLGAPALGTPDAAGHLWWDSWAHLSTAFHALLAEAALKALTAPL